jgi:hypothetical protein
MMRKIMEHSPLYPVRSTSLVLAVFLFVMGAGETAFAQELELWEDDPFSFNPRPKEDVLDLDGPEINEPFFAMILQWAADDSLGTWDADDVLAFTNTLGRESKFPMEQLARFSRHRPEESEASAWPGVTVNAIWKFELTGDLSPAMPYSVLGYHPGSLRVSQSLQLAETHLEGLALEGEDGAKKIAGIRIFRLDQGTVILDVDGWLDAFLGKKLDDAAVVGFVMGREHDQLVGVVVSLGKNGRHIYGEFDFRRDEVMPNGRAAASALSAACRAVMSQGQDDPLSRAWGR